MTGGGELGRTLMITDPAHIFTGTYKDFVNSTNSSSVFKRIQASEQFLASLSKGEGELEFPNTMTILDDYHYLGFKKRYEEFKDIGTVVSDSGLLCICDLNEFREDNDCMVKWEDFVQLTLINDTKTYFDEMPFIKWFCSSINGNPVFKLQAKYNTDGLVDGLLITEGTEAGAQEDDNEGER